MALQPLATVADLAARGVDVSDTARVEKELADASAAVRTYTRQILSLVENDTVTLYPDSCYLVLPQRPVIVDAEHPITFVVDGETVTDYTRRGPATFYRASGWGNEVVVTYSHGYEVIPDVIVGVVCDMAERGLTGTASPGCDYEQVGEYAYRLAEGAQSGSLGLLKPERESLRPFRRSARTVVMR